jgi:hypothetical protein
MSRAFIYKDPIDRQKHYAFLKAKAQAKLRDEPFEITIEQYMTLWTHKLWKQRGRSSSSLSWTRIKPNLPWTISNVIIMSRSDQLRYVVEHTMERRHAHSVE